jgi:hypothetical protein
MTSSFSGLLIQQQRGEGDGGVVGGAGLDGDGAVGLGVADEVAGGFFDLGRDGIAGLAIGIEHEAVMARPVMATGSASPHWPVC